MKLVSSSKNLLLRYYSKAPIPPVAARYMGSPVHPLAPKIVHLYENRDRNTLLWRVSVSRLTHLKRVVRSWCARRARIALEQALKQQGFDRQGLPIHCSSCSQQERLTGALDVTLQPPCVTASFETIQQDTHRLLQNILSERETHPERLEKTYASSSSSSESPDSR